MRLLQSLTRGLQAIDYMSGHTGPVRLTDVASALGVEKSNASHVLKTLVAAGFAQQDPSRRYRLTDKVASSARQQHSLEEIVACKQAWRPALQSLVAQTGECAHLAVLVKSQVWYIDKIDSTLPLKVDHPIGSLSPLHCTALGKAFLAFGAAEPEMPLRTYTDKTITSPDRLRDETQRVRAKGYAVDDEEFAPGIRCVARPVFDAEGRMIAAIGVSGPTVRIDDARLAELGAIVAEVSNEQTEEMGA
ncbi:IclR family transcriptional regulator [Nitratireductor sp. XY-223]|uniref:IclR family transcriptional regulator n=1 Tax=Nitratireductor sp. XY-223 TaxID=2561926 RepID=UPI0010AA0013|nr:IclR family transcriptional regulator [Nitratireductor sp. XY-223]